MFVNTFDVWLFKFCSNQLFQKETSCSILLNEFQFAAAADQFHES